MLVALCQSAPASADGGEECVVLLHGLFRSAAAMKPMEWYFEHAGYQVVNQGYNSLSASIEVLAESSVGAGLAACHGMGAGRVHLVTHSLGGVLVRQYAAGHPLAPNTRVVMLGPPNQGSQVAAYFAGLDWLDGLRPPAIEQLAAGEASVPLKLGPVDFQLGIIAGNLRDSTLLPGFPEGPSDGTVSVAETVVPGMLDFLQMPVLHTFMIWNPLVWEQAEHFLRTGAFRR
ncbi:alpha/beta hydrolase [Seongchinamella sediminis]|uniref:Alpha/beta hydrolase n=2 Tax=Seongchinamella sediminis TaxID=2283635 RepID=A0A3L7DSX7_9GAMM|nr:alpha/beta hydrolase [Seongchinamella sediminis]